MLFPFAREKQAATENTCWSVVASPDSARHCCLAESSAANPGRSLRLVATPYHSELGLNCSFLACPAQLVKLALAVPPEARLIRTPLTQTVVTPLANSVNGTRNDFDCGNFGNVEIDRARG
jgi:hypothetical protein